MTTGSPSSSPAPGRRVLVINAGSSSLKYQLVDPDTGATDASGLVERIRLPTGAARHEVDGSTHLRELAITDHAHAMAVLQEAFTTYGPDLARTELVAVGHRVVHGGPEFSEPTLITAEVVRTVERLIPLAPLHNPGNLQGIDVAQRAFPQVPQVAVFDTAFHQTMPPEASTYAVPRQWREEYLVRRYGFHGTSHAYVSRRVADLLERPLTSLRTIVLHLGNGASVTAVDGGRSVATSMGLTPLEGLVMGTRPGDIDPGLGGHLARMSGMSLQDYEFALSKESGLMGLTGSADFRELHELRGRGDADAELAYQIVIQRLLHYIGGYAAIMGGVDALAFTAGIGENDADLRADVLRRLAGFGYVVDEEANAGLGRGQEAIVTAPDSTVAAVVIPTNEEWEIARQAAELVAEL